MYQLLVLLVVIGLVYLLAKTFKQDNTSFPESDSDSVSRSAAFLMYCISSSGGASNGGIDTWVTLLATDAAPDSLDSETAECGQNYALLGPTCCWLEKRY